MRAGRKRRVLIAVALIAAAAVSLSVGIVLREKERSGFPDGGVYFAKTDSVLCLSGRKENPLVTLTAFEVKKGNYRSFLSWQDISLVGTDGKEYRNLDVSVLCTFTDAFFARYTVTVVLDLGDFETGKEVFLDRARLIGDEESAYCAIGNVGIFIGEKAENDPLSFGGYTETAEEFSSYTLLVTNTGKERVFLDGLKTCFTQTKTTVSVYSETGIPVDPDGYLLEGGQSVYLRAEFLPEKTIAEYPYLFFRPAVVWRDASGEERISSVGGTAYYNAMTDRAQLKTYLRLLGGVV